MNRSKFNLIKHSKYKYLTVDPLPNPIELQEFYKNEYFQNDNGSYDKEYTFDELELFKIDCKILNHLYSKTFPDSKRKSLLDVGCGEGFQSAYFHKKGWEINCFDYSEFGINYHNPELKEYFKMGDLESFLDPKNHLEKKYSVIILKNVLEHVISPTLVLNKLKAIMDEETLLYINVPNDYSLFQEYLLKNEYTQNSWFVPPQHLHYFQFSSLKNLVIGEGFNIVSMQAGYSIEQFLVNMQSNYFFDKEKGKDAHFARCKISNFLFNQDIEKYIKLRESYADLSFGREIVITLKL